MKKGREFKASKIDDAIQEGLKELAINKEDAEIEIISKGGLFKKAIVRISVKEKEQELGEEIKDESKGKAFIQKALKLMNMSCTVEEKIRGEEFCFYIKGNDVSRVIGYRGEVLDSLQLLTSNIINAKKEGFNRVIVDADFYRKRRKQTLEGLARRAAIKAVDTGESVELEPMSSAERRIVHMTLQQSDKVNTQSVGDGRDRFVVIMPAGEVNRVIEYGTTGFRQKGPQKTKSFGYKKKRI